jgi:hypothetical protein
MFEVDAETAELLACIPLGAVPFDPSGIPDFFIGTALRDPVALLDLHAKNFSEGDARIPDPPKIRTAINTDPNINALAIKNGSRQMISLNLGMCIRVRQMMWQATYNTEVFRPRPTEQALRPELLAESAAKFSPDWLLQPAILGPGLDQEAYYRLLNPVAPSVERIDLAMTLTRSALNFIILHEIAHLVRNQADFLPDRDSAFFMEVRDTLPAEEDETVALRRLLEADADMAAAEVAFRIARRNNIWADWTDDPLEGAALWIISVTLVFWLFQACNIAKGGDDLLHPPPLTRTMMLACGTVDRMPGLDLLSTENVVPFTVDALASAAAIWDSFGLSSEPSFSRQAALTAMSEVEELSRGLDQYGIRPR